MQLVPGGVFEPAGVWLLNSGASKSCVDFLKDLMTKDLNTGVDVEDLSRFLSYLLQYCMVNGMSACLPVPRPPARPPARRPPFAKPSV